MKDGLSFERFYVNALTRQAIDEQAFTKAVELGMPRSLYEDALSTVPYWKGYEPTPLHNLCALAESMPVASVACKDEGSRFGLGSFKALGGAYAVRALAARNQGAFTVACATEGNHGRSVAWGAQQAGVRCVIFLHERVSIGREQAIAKYGAEIRRVVGNYDDAVLACAEVSKAQGWTIVSDTTWPGYDEIPRIVMAGYGVMVKEILNQTQHSPTHVFLQAGVGGMAAAVMAAFHYFYDGPMPKFVVVEPENAACILASVQNGGSLTTIHGALNTISAGLACGAPSPLALRIINSGASAAISIADTALLHAMKTLAYPNGMDPAVVSGASGAAGLAGLQVMMQSDQLMSALGIGVDSHILVINTESDTDPDDYIRLLGEA